MKKLILTFSLITCASIALAEQPRYALKNVAPEPIPAAQQTYADIKSTLGILPTFLKLYPTT